MEHRARTRVSGLAVQSCRNEEKATSEREREKERLAMRRRVSALPHSPPPRARTSPRGADGQTLLLSQRRESERW